jgi:hypothetical protein
MNQHYPWGIRNPDIALRLATHILKGKVAMPWWRKDGPEEDEIKAEAAKLILENIGDADMLAKAKDKFGNDARSEWTVEELEQLAKDRKWWQWGADRN